MPKYEGGEKYNLWEYPRSGLKTKDIKKKERRAKVCDYNGQCLSPEPKNIHSQTHLQFFQIFIIVTAFCF